MHEDEDHERLIHGRGRSRTVRFGAVSPMQRLRETEAAERAKREFLANISHELRTPMNGVLGFTYLLRETALSPEQREYLDHIEQSGQQLLLLINDLIDFSLLEANRFELAKQRFTLADTLRSACDPWMAHARKKGLDFVLVLAEDLPAQVLGDAERLTQVLRHYLDNAIKFTHEGSIRVEVQVEQLSLDSLLLQISVQDTGIGQSPEDIARLFRRFEQGDGSTSRGYGGTGMGLAVVRTLTESMGGSVGAESCPGQGSRFWFRARLGLPQAPAAPLPAPAPGRPDTGALPLTASPDDRRLALQHCQDLLLLVEDSDAAAREHFLHCEQALRAVAPEAGEKLRRAMDAFDFDAAQQELEQLQVQLNRTLSNSPR